MIPHCNFLVNCVSFHIGYGPPKFLLPPIERHAPTNTDVDIQFVMASDDLLCLHKIGCMGLLVQSSAVKSRSCFIWSLPDMWMLLRLMLRYCQLKYVVFLLISATKPWMRGTVQHLCTLNWKKGSSNLVFHANSLNLNCLLSYGDLPTIGVVIFSWRLK